MATINRRRMLGTAVGGALAGPDLARDAIAGGAQLGQTNPFAFPLPPKTPYPSPAELSVKQVADKEWTLAQLAKAKRIASGDIRDEDRNYPTEGNPAPFRALKSVSEDARHFMRTAYYERQWRERTIKTALDALDHYDKTGILRTFF